jgi:hypothetical protein
LRAASLANLVDFRQHRSVEAGRPVEAVLACVAADELVDVVVSESAGGGVEGRECVVGEERMLSSGEQHLWDAGCG